MKFEFKLNLAQVALILVVVVFLAARPGFDIVTDTVIASGVDADGTFTTVTLSEDSYDCTFVNRDTTATNTADITINGGANKIRLYGGDTHNTADGAVPMLVDSFASDAVVGTPDIQYFCMGQ